MPHKRYDVIGLGSAIVDVLAFCDDTILGELGLAKGSMALIDESRAETLYTHMGPSNECSGGSAANTLAGLASLGGRGAFIGKVKRDQLGEIFTHDIRACGVQFNTTPADSGAATARCLIFVTPDAQRTMNTFLGACLGLTPADIDNAPISQAHILYLEGYLWDSPAMLAAARHAIATAEAADTRVALTLSDSFCVDRHRDALLAQLPEVDILFANEAEIIALTQAPDFTTAQQRAQDLCDIIVITRSEKGAVVLADGKVEIVPAEAVTDVVDTTGAGDLFASGFLYGATRGWDVRACASLGNACAGKIIQQTGARSAVPLDRLVA